MSKRKTVRPGDREIEISPVSIYGEVYGGKDLRKRCVLSLEWKREGVIDGDRGGDDSMDPTCSENVKDQHVDEAHGESERVYSKGGVLYVEQNGL